MDLSAVTKLKIPKNPCRSVYLQYQTIRDRVMEGECEPTLDAHRVIDRVLSTVAILSRTSYAVVIPLRDGQPTKGAYMFELSRLARSFGSSPKSGYRYILQAAPQHRVTIYEVLGRDVSRRSISVGGHDYYMDNKIHIVAFSKKQHAIGWCKHQYHQPPKDMCGLGHPLHIHCFW